VSRGPPTTPMTSTRARQILESPPAGLESQPAQLHTGKNITKNKLEKLSLEKLPN